MTLSCGYFLGVITVLVWKRSSLSNKKGSREIAVYEEPTALIEIKTEENVAYGPVKL